MTEDRNEYDWIFDYTMQFLESDNFDAVVMDFVDENCAVFENNEENKFSYTVIHTAFKEYVEVFMASNLGEIGITTELFLESCDKARNNRRINQIVFERLACLDDFMIFKKLMIRRNLELQLEAVREYCELERLKIINDYDDYTESKEYKDMTQMVDDAIRRTCLLIDELEQEEAELEQTKLQHAVELSLIPTEGLVQQHSTQIHSSPTRIYDESKSTSQPPPQQLNRAALPPVASIDIAPSKSQQQSSDRIESKSNDMKAVADHNRKGTSPINAISSNLPSIMSSITEEQKVRERGIHMAQQREKLLAIKKATRDKKVEEEAERAIADPTHAKLTERAQEAVHAVKVNKTSAPVHDDYYSNGITFGTPSFLTQHSNNDSPYSPTNESDRKRHELRQALANRLRFDLVQQEEEKEFKQQYDRFSTFDKHLKATESYAKQQKDQENAAKEVLEKQQTSLAKSIQNSKII